MIIDSVKLHNWLSKVTMHGTGNILEIIMNFDKEGLTASALTIGSLCMTKGTLSKDAFVEYESIGEIGIVNLPEVMSVLKRFEDQITLSVIGNMVTISEAKKSVDIELCEISCMERAKEFEFADFTESFVVPSDTFNRKIFMDYAVSTSAKKESDIAFFTEPGLLKVNILGKYKFHQTIDNKDIVGGVGILFGEYLTDPFKNLRGDIRVSMKTDYPMMLEEIGEDYTVKIFVAPRVNSK